MSNRTTYTDWLSAPRVAEELEVDPKRVREWAHRRVDPLPVRFIDGNRKQWRVYRRDLDTWLMRNSSADPYRGE